MATPTSTIICGNYVVIENGNTTDITTLGTKTQIGTVRQIGWMVDWCAVGDKVMYNPVGATQFQQAGTTYNVIVQEMVILITTGVAP